jgi:hypothetical protein
MNKLFAIFLTFFFNLVFFLRAEEPALEENSLVSKPNSQTFFVVFNAYLPTIPPAPAGLTDYQRDNFYNTLNINDILFTASQPPYILIVSSSALQFYRPEFFKENNRLASYFSMIMKSHSGKLVRLTGALLIEVLGVFDSFAVAKTSFPILNESIKRQRIIQLNSGDGKFQGMVVIKDEDFQYVGGPFEIGWSDQRKQDAVDMAVLLESLTQKEQSTESN